MNEDFVTYELAVKLKEKGFNIPFYFFYRSDDKLIHHAMVSKPLVYCDEIDDEVVIAPTIPHILKWLREVKKLHLEISFWCTTGTWSCKVVKITSLPDGDWNVHRCESYEDAAIKAIEHLLKYWI